MSEKWRLKLKSMLHDPPHKLWVMFSKEGQKITPYKAIHTKNDHKWHEIVAEHLLNLTGLFYEECIKDEDIEKADRIASALSRIIMAPGEEEKRKKLEEELLISWEEVIFIDPFQGTTLKPDNPEHEEIERLFSTISELSTHYQNISELIKFFFLFLWRFYPEIFPWINTHPADTRAPNHSIYDHLVQTSAVVSTLPHPAFLLFTISPVQSFITTARKTQDLWSGSYILSYLIWNSMLPIIEKFGPDNIIFPNLRGQPLMDVYLKQLKFNEFVSEITKEFSNKTLQFNDDVKKLTIANLPNRFLTIIPYDLNIAKECEEKFQRTLEEVASKTIEKLAKFLELNKNSSFKIANIENEIIKHIFSYFQVYWVVLPWCKEGKLTDVTTILEEYKTIIGKTKLYHTIKFIIDHPYYKSQYNSIYVGSAYSLLVELTERLLGARKSIRNTLDTSAYIQERTKCTLCGEFNELSLTENEWEKLMKKYILRPKEKLCGVCMVKRLFPEVFEDFLKKKGYFVSRKDFVFPSVAEIASIGFKRSLTKEEKEQIKREFEKFHNKIKLPEGTTVPKLKKENDVLSSIDGMFLIETTYRKEFFEEEFGKDLNESDFKDILETLRELKQQKGKTPSTYYAILQMDGDNMGKWLKGEFNPLIGKLLLPKAKDVLLALIEEKERKDFEVFFCKPHPPSPSIHQAFSRKLSEFALTQVREIVEDEHYGKLVYAGGDDVLAFLPIEEVLTCAYRLQKAFKEIVSNKASMSAGIVIVHYKYPLYLALNEVRLAEKKAKNEFGKNAFCIKIITHSGESRLTGGNWELIGFIEEIICKFKSQEISSRFPYQFLEVAESLDLKEILKEELKRLYLRKTTDAEFLQEILEKFEAYPFGSVNFANLLVIARTLAKESRI